MSSKWYYTRDGQQREAASLDTLRSLVASEELRSGDMVWTDGWADWRPAGQVPALFASAPTDVTPISAAVPASAIEYYQPGSGMPPRAAANLKGHATPIGDSGTWPLDDTLFAQISGAFALRKKIIAAAQLYRALLLLTSIVATVAVVAGIVTMGTGGGRSTFGASVGVMGVGVFLVAMSVLYYFLWKATARSHRWAPLTYFIICLIAILLGIVSAAVGASGSDAADVIGPLVSLIFPAIFAVVSWKAYAAIPKYRAFPAWCQEIVAKSGS